MGTKSSLGSRAGRTHLWWTSSLLRVLGAQPGTTGFSNAEWALTEWAAAENVTPGANNWLAITNPNDMYGKSTPLPGNSAGVAMFAPGPAVISTAEFLRGGYPGIVKALTDPNATMNSIGTAVYRDGTTAGGGPDAWPAADAQAIINAGETGTHTTWTGGSLSVEGSSTQLSDSGPNRYAAGTASSFSHCNSQNTIIGGGGLGMHFNLLNPCQAKAIVGGMIIGVGAVIFVTGAALLVSGVLKGPINAVAASGPVGVATRLFGGGKSDAAASPVAVTESPRSKENHVWDDMFKSGSIDEETWKRGSR